MNNGTTPSVIKFYACILGIFLIAQVFNNKINKLKTNNNNKQMRDTYLRV